MATKTRVTVDDLWRLGEGDIRRELVNGEVLEMAPVGGVHGQIVARITRCLAEFVEGQGAGEVLVGDVGFVLPLAGDPERVRAPDVAFVARDRMPAGGLPDGFVREAPDLAVEVLSPTDNPLAIQEKLRDYLDPGSRLVWLVAPQARTVTVYRQDGSARLLRETEILDGEEILPGFHMPLSDLF